MIAKTSAAVKVMWISSATTWQKKFGKAIFIHDGRNKIPVSFHDNNTISNIYTICLRWGFYYIRHLRFASQSWSQKRLQKSDHQKAESGRKGEGVFNHPSTLVEIGNQPLFNSSEKTRDRNIKTKPCYLISGGNKMLELYKPGKLFWYWSLKFTRY